MAIPHTSNTSPHPLFEFRGLEGLPCGCVAADYVATSIELGVVAVEVKGPHCTRGHHTAGTLLTQAERGELTAPAVV
jgi:hypothetical protein